TPPWRIRSVICRRRPSRASSDSALPVTGSMTIRVLPSADWSFDAAACKAGRMTAPRVRSRTAMCLTSVGGLSLTMAWTAMLPPIMTGISTREIRNALVRTAALYSRAAMTRTLRTGHLAGRGVLGGGDADEDVVQRRPGQLEVAAPAALHQPAQQLLRV